MLGIVATLSTIRPGEYVPTADQRVVMQHVPWAVYEALDRMRGDKRVPRLSYSHGTLEITSPSQDHDRLASWIGRLVEIWAEEHDVELAPYRSWTLKHPEKAGAEADECYTFGPNSHKVRPDLAIEIVWTSGGIDKLEVYRELEVSEVWFWIEGSIQVYCLEADGYRRCERSRWLAELDLDLLCSFLDLPFGEAKRAYRAALRAR